MTDSKEEEKQLRFSPKNPAQTYKSVKATDMNVTHVENKMEPEKSYTREDATNLVEYIVNSSKPFIALVCVLVVIVLLLISSYILYCIQFSQDVVHWNMTYMNISDIIVSVYEFSIIILCGLFIREYYKGKIETSNSYIPLRELTDINIDIYEEMNILVRHKSDATFWELTTHLVNNLDLNQYTVAAMFCLTHHLYASILLFIAVYNGANSWYIASALTFGLGAFSIPLPGICFQSHLKLCQQQEDLNRPSASALTAVESFQHTVFNNVVVRATIIIGFAVQFFQFISLPALKDADLIIFYSTLYDCENSKCSDNADFIVNELIFRVFVGMTIVNNMGLFVNGINQDTIAQFSLMCIRTIIHPLVYPIMLVILMVEIRFATHPVPYPILRDIINFIGIAVHLFTILLCFVLVDELYKGKISVYKQKVQNMNVNYTVALEAILILIIALISFIFLAVNGGEFTSLLRQFSVWLYLLIQMFVILVGITLAKVKNFSREVSVSFVKRCFKWLCILNLYDFLYSFVDDSQQFAGWVNRTSGDNSIYYKWSFGLSFSFSHVLMWSLALCVEFIMKLDQDTRTAHRKRLRTVERKLNDFMDNEDDDKNIGNVDDSNEIMINPKKHS
eukprot:63086_1